MASRPFIALYITVFVAVMGISMVSPLLPVYSRELGANGVWLGLTFSAFAITQAIAGPFVGRLSDRYPRKPFIVAGLLIYLTAAMGYLFATSFWHVIAFRAFSGLGTSCIFSVAQAYVGDLTPRGREGRWFGVFATANVFGFGTGPLLAGGIREGVGFDAVFVAMAAMMALSCLIVVVSLPRHAPKRVRDPEEEAGYATSILAAAKDRMVMALTMHSALVSITFGASLSFLSLRLEEDLHIGPTLIGLAIATQDLTAGLSQPLFGRLVDRHDRRRLVALGLGVLGALLVGLGLAGSYWLAVLLLLGMGAATGLAGVAGGAIQVVVGRRVGMGTVIGLWSMGNGAGIIAGSLVGGALVATGGTTAAFFFGGLVVIIGVPVFLFLTRGMSFADRVAPIERRDLGVEPGAAGQ